MGEIYGRHRGDMGLAPAEAALRRDGGQLAEHLTGDTGEIQGRYRGDIGEI